MYEDLPVSDRTSVGWFLAVSGDCFQCQKCIDICPQKHIHCGIRKLKGNEFWFTILRALILLGICLWLGL